jgi:ABC-type amino acid transport substrate-binding protein
LALVGALLVGALLAAFLVACSSPADPTWERLRETETLRVGMDASFPPFESIAADGSLVGLDVDLAREVSARLGLEPRFVANLPYDGLYDALTAERVDVVISALVVDPSRMDRFAYSSVYFDAGHVLVSRAGRQTFGAMADLGGHRLAVVLGTEGDREGRRWARRLADLVVVQYRTPAQALSALESGETDAALVDHVSALHVIGEHVIGEHVIGEHVIGEHVIGEGSDLVIVGEPVIHVPYACAMRRDSHGSGKSHLLRAVNEALAAMEDDGTMEALVSKWLR